MNMRPYKKYKNVQYDYVKQIPEDWELLPNIAIFQERIERGHINEELLSVTIGNGVIRQADVKIKKDSSNEDKSKYKLIKVGDIAYNKMRMWQGALGYSNYQGISSPAYVILKPKMKINPKYFHYMFRATFYTNYSKQYSYGIVDDQLSLRYTDFKRMYTIVPPLNVQNSIVTYLDKKIAITDKFIQNKLKLINLLIEEKIAIINIYVSQGNNTSTGFQDCLVKWINKIPNHWKQKKLKYLLIESNTRSKYGKEQLLSLSKYKGVVPQNEVDSQIARASSLIGYKHVEPNDIVINKMQANNGLVGLSQIYGITSPDYSIYKIKEEYYPQYLGLLLSSKFYVANYNLYSKGVMDGYVRLYTDDLFNIFGIVPPIEEQKNIVEIIEQKHNEINLLIYKTQKEISSIKEYSDSLITEIVTGKRSIP